jgi:hypothetical protein
VFDHHARGDEIDRKVKSLSRAGVNRFVPDVFEPGNMAWSLAGLSSKLQLSFADR